MSIDTPCGGPTPSTGSRGLRHGCSAAGPAGAVDRPGAHLPSARCTVATFGCGGVARGAARSFVAETAAGPIAMTPPADLLGEVVDRVPLVDAVVLADAVLARHELMAKDMLSEWSTNPRLRQVARLADGRAQSPMEARLRPLFVLAGLPTPVLQHPVRIEGANRRLDLAYPQWHLARAPCGEDVTPRRPTRRRTAPSGENPDTRRPTCRASATSGTCGRRSCGRTVSGWRRPCAAAGAGPERTGGPRRRPRRCRAPATSPRQRPARCTTRPRRRAAPASSPGSAR